MAERIAWDKYEAAILLEAVFRIEANAESKNDAIERVSKQLRSMARNRGLSIDDVYRNTNGISMQMAAMKATAFDLESKMRSHSKVFCEIVALYHTNKLEYDAVLNQAYIWIDNNKEEQHMTLENTHTVRSNRDAFSSWLQVNQIKKPVPNLIMMAIDEVSEYAIKHNVSKVSIWDISDEDKFNALRIKMQAIRLFRLSNKNAATIFDMCWKHYIDFLKYRKSEEISAAETQETKPNENTNHIADNDERKIDIDSFYEWMKASMVPSSCRAYASSFRTACDYALSNGLTSEKLYEIADDEILKEQTETILQDAAFQNYNSDQHNRFSAALKKYLEYRTGIVLPLRTQKDAPIQNTVCYSYREQVVEVLREHYPYGFRLESIIDLKRFRRYAEEHNAELPESDDNLKVEIRKAGVKIEDKVFLIEQNTFLFIRKTIDTLASDGSKILFYDCIYDSDASGMEEHYITSADQLKAIMKQCRDNIFEDCSEIYFAKNFVSLLGEQMEKDAVTIELQRVWGESQTRRADELTEQLPAIPEEYVRRYLSGSTAFVWISDGTYFSMQRFIITEDEREAILFFVAEECDNKGYASISDVPFGNTEEENYELTTVGLQEAVYNAVLLNQYYLNGKILTRDNKSLDVVTLAKQYLIGKNECTFDEMDKKVEEIAGTRYRYMAYDALYSTMIRVDKNRYVAHQYVKFDVDAIDWRLIMAKRKYGDGSVFERKDGRWEGRLVVGYKENGYAKTKSVTAPTKTECEERLKKLREEVGRRSERIKPDMLFGDWIDFWYQNFSKPKLRPTTQACYEGRIYTHIIPQIGQIPLCKLTQNELQQFYARLKKGGRKKHVEKFGEGLSDRMVRSCHTTCRTALEKAVTEGLIRVNPAVGCKLPPKKAKEMQVLTPAEVIRFLTQAKEEGYYEIFLLELTTGMRRGEIIGLKWRDLDLTTGELHIARQVIRVKGETVVSQPKTKSSIRTVILAPDMVEILAELKQTVAGEWMFPSPVNEGQPRNPCALYHRFQTILERAKCKKVRFHDLRHTFATMAIENGMDIKTLSTMIGHVSAETTLNIYSHITDTMQQQAAVKIDREIGGTDAQMPEPTPPKASEQPTPKNATEPKFEPYKGKIRKPGTGCVTMINDHLYEGRFTPTNADGKRISRNIYAQTREECEEKLAVLIVEMKSEIKAEKERRKQAASA